MTVIDIPSKQARYARRKSAENAEIGPPPITDEQRAEGQRLWALCRDDLEAFNVVAFPNSTGLKPLGPVQKASIAHDQSVIKDGGRIAKAEPRGYGKTSRCCNAALWGVLGGWLNMIPVFSANLEKSKTQIMARWKTELMSNDVLFCMHPELIWPFRALGNRPQAAPSQTYNGELTHIKWTADRIVFPHLPDVVGSGAALIALPLKSCRGATHTTPDGTILRPDMCIFDDVQNDEDAENPNTIRKLEELIEHTALMLGGHSQTMSAIMNCTVRRTGDLSERFLKKSSWRRVRYRMLTSPAKREKEFWLGEYATVRKQYNPEDPDDQRRAHLAAKALYESKRFEADEGAVATWEWAYTWADDEPTEVSAIQHAYNILIDLGESVFASECQNEPVEEKIDDDDVRIFPSEVLERVNNIPRAVVPINASRIVAFIDPKKEILHWTVCAFADGFSGWVLDYGTYPDQKQKYVSSRSPVIPLSKKIKGNSWEEILYAGLTNLINELAARRWRRDDGSELAIERLLVDHNWGPAKATIDLCCRQNPNAGILLPSKGMSIRATMKPMNTWAAKPGERRGNGWTIMPLLEPGAIRDILFDTNLWKTFVSSRIKTGMGGRGCLTIFGTEKAQHQMLADHLASEIPKLVISGDRRVIEWLQPPGIDNDFFDCIVGCHVAAAERGVSLHEQKPVQRVRVKLSDLKKTAHRWTPNRA